MLTAVSRFPDTTTSPLCHAAAGPPARSHTTLGMPAWSACLAGAVSRSRAAHYSTIVQSF